MSTKNRQPPKDRTGLPTKAGLYVEQTVVEGDPACAIYGLSPSELAGHNAGEERRNETSDSGAKASKGCEVR